MARVYHMTWIPSRRGWMKEYKGRKYAISCRQLGVQETKDSSYQAANAWWEAKKAEIDAADRPQPFRPLLPLEDLAASTLGIAGPLDGEDVNLILGLETAYAEQQSGREEIVRVNKDGSVVQWSWPNQSEAPSRFEDRLALAVRMAATRIVTKLLEGEIPVELTSLPPARLQQVQDSIAGVRGEPAAPSERTIKAHSVAWLAVQEKMVAAGQITAARVNNVRMALTHFTRWLGETADIASIDATKLQGFYEYCLTQVAARRKDKKAGWSLPFAKEVFAVSRSWLKWLAEQGTIDPPRNLASRFRFGNAVKKIATWTVDEVRHVIEEAPGKLKLALLLMVNCGMTQQDVSDLLDDEVDWTQGTITRRRSKTKNNENVPVVTYRLWPVTWQLLQQYRSGTDRVLLTESGKPYVRNEMVNGKLVKADGFTSNYAHLKRRLKFTKPMKQLRKTAATLLESHEVYGRFKHYFLGHSPRSIADRYYAAPDQGLFDKAVWWLGQQLGQVPVEGKPADPAQQAKRRKKDR